MQQVMQVLAAPAGSTAWLLMWLLKGSVLLAVLFPLAGLLRRASSSTRHTIWTAGLAVALLLPLLSSGVLPLRVEVPAQVADVLRMTEATAVGDVAPPTTQAPSWSAEESRARAETASRGNVAPRTWTAAAIARVLFMVWLAGAALLLLRLVASTLKLRALVRGAKTVTESAWTTPLFEAADRLDLADVPRIVMSERAAMPFTCGIREPLIVLPTAAAEWTDERRRAVLCHELAHIRRRDLLSHLLGRVTCALYWFQPLAWSAARRMRAESERACDDLVISSGTRASAYADHLLQIVTAAKQGSAPVVALPMAQAREFEARLLSILAPAMRRDPLTRGQSGLLVALVLLVALPLVALSPVPPQQPGADGSSLIAEDEESAPDSQDEVDEELAGVPDPQPEPDADPRPEPEVDVDLHDMPQVLAQEVLRAKAGKHEDEQERSDPRVIAALLEALRGNDAEVRRTAAWALSNHRDTAVVRGLATALAGDADPAVREMAGWAIAELEMSRSRVAIDALARAMQNDRDPKVRFIALWALAQLGSAEAAPAIEQVLRNDPSEDQRAVAAWALGELQQRSSVDALAAALASPNVTVRERAAWALGEIEAKPAPAQLISALQDADADVRTVAAWALGSIGDAAAANSLATALNDSDTGVRKAAIWALGNMPAEGAVDALTRALRSEDADIRRAAAAALGGRGSYPWPWPRPWPMPRPHP